MSSVKVNSSDQEHNQLYQKSIQHPEEFWAERAGEFIEWARPWNETMQKDAQRCHAKWFLGGMLNVSSNCLDRHLIRNGDKTAIIWEGDDPGETLKITYRDLFKEVCKFSNVLKSLGVEKGDRVCIYMPNVIETAVAMLSCARIGAVHSVVFAGFSANALRDRIEDTGCKVVITVNEGMRGGKPIPIKKIVDEALAGYDGVEKVVVVKRTDNDTAMVSSRDVWYQELMEDVSDHCFPVEVESNDPLFILYTSGSTGKPKGIVHSSAGYFLHVCSSFKYVFDYQEEDIYWCTAELAWVTGHSYGLYGPLGMGATVILFEGVPTYPSPSRYWEIVDKYKVNIMYTAPTILRTLVGEGTKHLEGYSLDSLKRLGSVGEPIDTDTWNWYHKNVGKNKCPIMDTWWQTETGGIMITQLPSQHPENCGQGAYPQFGIAPDLADDDGNLIEAESGNLVVKHPWPGQMQGIYNNEKRFLETYFTPVDKAGYYLAGDRVERYEDGSLRVTGRADDTLNVAGHLLGSTEIEAALILHDAVSEAAVVGYPHAVKGQGIYAYVALIQSHEPSQQIKDELNALVRKEISGIAKPDVIHWTTELPKTRSGKVMRRILRKISANELDDLGDTTTLVNPTIVQALIDSREDAVK